MDTIPLTMTSWSESSRSIYHRSLPNWSAFSAMLQTLADAASPLRTDQKQSSEKGLRRPWGWVASGGKDGVK